MASFRSAKGIGVALDTPTASAVYPLGMHAYSDDAGGKCYRYVKFVDGITYVSGHVVVLASATTWDVTNDVAGGSALAGHLAIGFVQGTVPTENQYGWVQCGGIVDDAVMGAGAVSAGVLLKPDATENGDIDVATAGTHWNVCAVAMATISENEAGVVKVAIQGH